MKLNRTRTLVAALLLLVGGTATANDQLWIGARASTLGLGLEATWRPIPWLDFRAGVNTFDYDDDGVQAGISYDATLELRSTYATANLLFPVSPMRLTAGIFANDNTLELASREQPTYVIGGMTFTHEQVGQLRATTSFDSPSPYVGIGFDFDLVGRLGMNLDLGVLWQDSPLVALSADGSLADDPNFQESMENERLELEDEYKDFKAWPVVSLGLQYNFY